MTENGLVVWPVLISKAHGEETDLLGVYASREAAFRAIRAEPNMTAYVDDRGELRGRPVKELTAGEMICGRWIPVHWAHGWPEIVKDDQQPDHAE